jgi:hypothetical protein
MCTVLLPPGVNQIAVNKCIINIISSMFTENTITGNTCHVTILHSNLITLPRKLYASQNFIQGRFHPNIHKRTAEYPDLPQISVSCCHTAIRCLITLSTKKYVKVLSRETFVSVFRSNEWWSPHSQISGQSVNKIKSKKH